MGAQDRSASRGGVRTSGRWGNRPCGAGSVALRLVADRLAAGDVVVLLGAAAGVEDVLGGAAVDRAPTEMGLDVVLPRAGGDRVGAVRGVDEVGTGAARQLVVLTAGLCRLFLVVAPDHVAIVSGVDGVVPVGPEQLVVVRGGLHRPAGAAAVAVRLTCADGVLVQALLALVQAVAAVRGVLAVERVLADASVHRTVLVELVHQQHAVDLRPAVVTGHGGCRRAKAQACDHRHEQAKTEAAGDGEHGDAPFAFGGCGRTAPRPP